MAGKIAIRDAYGDALKELGGINEKVVALEADVGGSTKSAVFGKAYPDRYFNVGIDELNMVSMAAGFARCGLIPFVNTFAVFMTTRSADPIQSLICYDNLNVKLCGTYCGLSDSYDGASHQAITDVAFVRAIPNMTVISVADAVETKKAVMAIAEHNGPVYLRLSMAAVPVVYDDSLDYKIGRGIVVRDGKDVTIMAVGSVLSQSLDAANILAEEGISARVVDMHTIKPIDEELVIKCAKETGAIVTVEEHSVYGGLGSAVAEVLSKKCPTKMDIIGATEYAESGDYEQLLGKYGYDGKSIAARAKALI